MGHYALACIISGLLLCQAAVTARPSASDGNAKPHLSRQGRQLLAGLSHLFTGVGRNGWRGQQRQPYGFGPSPNNVVSQQGCWQTRHQTRLVPVYRTVRRANTRCYNALTFGREICNTTYKYFRQITHYKSEQSSRMVCCEGWRTTPGEDACTTRVEGPPTPSPTPPTESPLERELAQLKNDYKRLRILLELERQVVVRMQSELDSERSALSTVQLQLEECRNVTFRQSQIDSINPCRGRSCPGHPKAVCASYGDCCGGQESIFWLDENGEPVECGTEVSPGVSVFLA